MMMTPVLKYVNHHFYFRGQVLNVFIYGYINSRSERTIMICLSYNLLFIVKKLYRYWKKKLKFDFVFLLGVGAVDRRGPCRVLLLRPRLPRLSRHLPNVSTCLPHLFIIIQCACKLLSNQHSIHTKSASSIKIKTTIHRISGATRCLCAQ